MANAQTWRSAGRDLSVLVLTARGDWRDLLEMLGNLMDNACKFCRSSIRIMIHGGDLSLPVAVHDDGPGIAPQLREYVMQRGVRADLLSSGQGIGLAVVQDIASSYCGRMILQDSPLGGACIRLEFDF